MTEVFVSVGTMMPFDRLIRAMDDWAKDHPITPVFFQIGKGSSFPFGNLRFAM